MSLKGALRLESSLFGSRIWLSTGCDIVPILIADKAQDQGTLMEGVLNGAHG